jgi:hypothetical protein
MSRHNKKPSKWRLMGAGASLVAFRRVFLIALTAVSLVVWTVTVIGIGVLRQGSGLGGTVKTAEAAGPLLSSKEAAMAIEWVTHQETPAVDGVQAVDPARYEPPSRNPFAPAGEFYPRRMKNGTEGPRVAAKGEDTENRARLDRRQLVPLRLEGTLALGKQKVAIVYGNSFDFGGRTMLLMLKEIQSQFRVNDKAIVVKDVVTHFKVGDTIEVRPVRDVDSQVYISDESLTLTVLKITSSSVELTLGEQPHILLRMRK